MPAAIKEKIVVCPDCSDFCSLPFRGKQPISNPKWRLGHGNCVYHCKCPCHIITFN